VPAIDERLKVHKKVRLLYQLGEDFTGYKAEAIFDDAGLGVGHLTAFERFAVSTHVPRGYQFREGLLIFNALPGEGF
jgi:hypothetical protein